MRNVPGGKGSSRRPSQVPTEAVDNNWERIFGKKAKEETKETCPNGCPNCRCGKKPPYGPDKTVQPPPYQTVSEGYDPRIDPTK